MCFSPLLRGFRICFAAECLSDVSMHFYKSICMWIYLSTKVDVISFSFCMFALMLKCSLSFGFRLFHILIHLCRLAQMFDPTWRRIPISSEEETPARHRRGTAASRLSRRGECACALSTNWCSSWPLLVRLLSQLSPVDRAVCAPCGAL